MMINNPLLIVCNPNPKSLTYFFKDRLQSSLSRHGAKFNMIDLYQIEKRYQLSPKDMATYNDGRPFPDLADIMQAMHDCDSLIFLFPVWMYGPPSPLKGLLERLIRPGITFDITESGVQPLLTNIKHQIVICSSGQKDPKMPLVQDPVHHTFHYMMKDNFSPDCNMDYLRLYGTDHLQEGDVESFCQKIETAINTFT